MYYLPKGVSGPGVCTECFHCGFFTGKDPGVMQLSHLVLSFTLNHIFTVLDSGNHLSPESLQGLGNLFLVTFLEMWSMLASN